MRTSPSTLLACLSVTAAIAAIGHAWVFEEPELSFPAAHLVHRDVFPQATLDAVDIGSPISVRFERFGMTPTPVSEFGGTCCVRFRYDPDIVAHPVALVFLVRATRVQAKWLMRHDALPAECDGLWTDTVELTRYYDAAWCCPWPG